MTSSSFIQARERFENSPSPQNLFTIYKKNVSKKINNEFPIVIDIYDRENLRLAYYMHDLVG